MIRTKEIVDLEARSDDQGGIIYTEKSSQLGVVDPMTIMAVAQGAVSLVNSIVNSPAAQMKREARQWNALADDLREQNRLIQNEINKVKSAINDYKRAHGLSGLGELGICLFNCKEKREAQLSTAQRQVNELQAIQNYLIQELNRLIRELKNLRNPLMRNLPLVIGGTLGFGLIVFALTSK